VTARRRSLIALAMAAPALAGCVPGEGFPSLAPRPAERNLSTEEPVHPAVEVPGDPALRARVAELERQAAEGNRAFDAAYGATEAAVAAAGPAGSDSWVAAEQALSRLEMTRGPTTRALAELDQLAIDRAETPTNAEDFALINAALASVDLVAAGQQQRWDRLHARLERA
jgi:hypothetical protein